MPQLDLETLVSIRGGGGSGRKIACETQADSHDDAPEVPYVPDADVPPDFPPESFWLSKDAELDWFDRNAIYERKESTKGNANSTNLNPNLNTHSNSSSQRFSMNLKSKAAIIGLPKPQKTNYADTKRRHGNKPPNVRLFPKRSESVGKSAVSVTEPSSPKVSCMGRVRSKKGRRRSSGPVTETEKPVVKIKPDGRRKTGFCSGLIGLFRSDRCNRGKAAVKINEPVDESPPRPSVTRKAREYPVAEPPGLGNMTRFVSGRRSESWSAEDIDLARL